MHKCDAHDVQVAVVTKRRKVRPAEPPVAAAAQAQAAPGTRAAAPAQRAASDVLDRASPAKQAADAAQGLLRKAASDSLAAQQVHAVGKATAGPAYTLLPGYASRPHGSPLQLSPVQEEALLQPLPLGELQQRAVKRQLAFSQPSQQPGEPVVQPAAPDAAPASTERKDSGSAVALVKQWHAAAGSSAPSERQASPVSPGALGQQDILAALASELEGAPASRPSQEAAPALVPAPSLQPKAEEAAAQPRPRAKPSKRSRSFQVGWEMPAASQELHVRDAIIGISLQCVKVRAL